MAWATTLYENASFITILGFVPFSRNICCSDDLFGASAQQQPKAKGRSGTSVSFGEVAL